MDRFFLTDLDGTLLKDDTSISENTIEIFKNAFEKGLIISYSTARSYISSKSATHQIPWKYPIILYNGALIFDPVEKVVIEGFWLNREIANSIIEVGKRQDLTPLLFCLDKQNNEHVLHERLKKRGDIEFYNSRKNDPRFKELEELICTEDYRTLIITYIGFYDELEPLRQYFEMKYKGRIHIHFMKDNYIEEHYFLEITNIKANKEDGLIAWCKLVGCKPSEVTVFGDNLNDLGMFSKAGKKVAVLNADPVIKEKSDKVIPSNEEDGVANYINNIAKKLL
mgnify:CR=1 FL=1